LQGRGYQVRFGPPHTPDVIKTIILVNVGVYILQRLWPPLTILASDTPELIWQHGWIWQPFTYMWLHDPGSILHIAFNMLALWMFGSPVAEYWGERRFLRFYLICGTGAGVVIAAWPALPLLWGAAAAPQYAMPTLGASGAIFGVLLAYSLMWPDRTIFLIFPPIPIKAIYFIPLIFLIDYLGGPANISHVGHIGGLLVGWLLLQRMGITRGYGLKQLHWRWKRWRMRRRFRAVHSEQNRRRDDDERMYH
jgi:membrane associated rhomboid family serine protease